MAMARVIRLEQRVELVAGGRGIAQLELHGLALLHHLADRHGTCGPVRTEQIADEKIPALEPVSLFIDDDAEMQRAIGLLLGILR